jgi:hypothetical protein
MIKAYLCERKKVLLFAAVVVLITTIPYLIGYARETNEWVYTGFVIAIEDGNSYIAKMLTGSVGKWLFKSPFTAYEQKGVFAFLPYIMLGKLAAGDSLHTQLVALYQGFRILGIILFFLAGYDFIALYIKDEKWRLWALAVLGLGGGGGWILVLLEKKNLLGSLPLDFISPESFGFLSLLAIPHLAVGRALFLWSLTTYLESKSGFLIGLCLFLLGFMQPIYVVVAWVVIISHIACAYFTTRYLWKLVKGPDISKIKDDSENLLKALLISSPFIIYTAITFLSDPYLKTWALQNQLPSPHLVHYLIAYGLSIPFAILGVIILIHKKPRRALLIAGWFLIFPILVSLPVSTQRRLAEGFWAAITVGVIGYFEGKKRIPKIIYVLLFSAFPSTLVIIAGSVLNIGYLNTPLYRPKDEILIYKKLTEISEIDSVVLSSYEIGNNLPAWVPVRVAIGHGPETANWKNTYQDVDLFYQPDTEAWTREQILKKYQVEYVINGPIENDLGGWDPRKCTILKPIYEIGEYAIYVPVEKP